MNADIILPPNILNAINLIDRWSKKMIIGNRLDLDLRYKINYNDYKWWQKLFDYAIIEGEWHKKGGIDYFIFPKKLWKPYQVGILESRGILFYYRNYLYNSSGYGEPVASP